ncbi:hypothetical protein [Streptomyces fuscichromogenes]|uniref:Uncharacterized protein n=1 Tax=Streptomyces fuscichromogenes TaxID=1324013 RepID=A0A917XJR5_9ACTN|nr:hypothetical protein [Streptomyces fuscichromogenes]GGN32638.1 hypothetical protein GCM10011578_071560 [Streptomyces fuscichromogenes]
MQTRARAPVRRRGSFTDGSGETVTARGRAEALTAAAPGDQELDPG